MEWSVLGHPSEEVPDISYDIHPAADCQDVRVLGQQGRVDDPPLVLRLLEVRVWGEGWLRKVGKQP